MSDTTNTAGPADETEGHSDPAESFHEGNQARQDGIHPPRPALGLTPVASLGFLVAVTAGVLIQNPEVRKACRGVLQDAEVHKACREAGHGVYRAVAASWRQHGGMVALADVLGR